MKRNQLNKMNTKINTELYNTNYDSNILCTVSQIPQHVYLYDCDILSVWSKYCKMKTHPAIHISI